MAITQKSNSTARIVALVIAAALTLAALGFLSLNFAHAESEQVLPSAAIDNPRAAGSLQTAVLAGGCFGACRACSSM